VYIVIMERNHKEGAKNMRRYQVFNSLTGKTIFSSDSKAIAARHASRHTSYRLVDASGPLFR